MSTIDKIPAEVNEMLTDNVDKITGEVREFKPVDVDEKFVTFQQHVTTFRKVGNRMTSIVSERLKNGSLINSVVTTEVTPIDEDFLLNLPRYIKDKDKAARKRNCCLKHSSTDDRFPIKENYYASVVVEGQGRPLEEVLLRAQAGVETADYSKGLSFDEDLPFIDDHNWFKIGGRP